MRKVREMATELFKAGRYEEALRLRQADLATDPDDPRLNSDAGWALKKMGAPPQVIFPYWKKAVDGKPDNPIYHDNVGFVLHELGEHERATDHYRTAVELQPKNALLRAKLAISYMNQGCLMESFGQWFKAAELAPNNKMIRDNLERNIELLEAPSIQELS